MPSKYNRFLVALKDVCEAFGFIVLGGGAEDAGISIVKAADMVEGGSNFDFDDYIKMLDDETVDDIKE